MSFQLTDEHEMIRLMAREFARKELEPYTHQMDQDKIFPYDVVKKMGELGLMGMMVPSDLELLLVMLIRMDGWTSMFRMIFLKGIISISIITTAPLGRSS